MILVSWLAAACGAGGGDASQPVDGGRSDAKSPADGGATADSGATRDSGATPDSGSSTDDGGTLDSESTADSGTSPQAVNLGTAANYVILAKTAISTVPTSAIMGNLGINPAAASYITGFSPLAMDASGQFSTCSQVTGMVYAPGYAAPTGTNLTAAVDDMLTAFTDAAGRAPSVTELGAGSIGGRTLAAGVYKWSSGLLIATDITLGGSATDVWIFQIAQDLTVSDAAIVTLTGGGIPKNVFWQVSGATSIGTTAHVEGVILDKTAIALGTGASVNGRLLAQTAVTLDSNMVVQPAP